MSFGTILRPNLSPMNTTLTRSGCQILIANDSSQSLDLLQCLLKNWGYNSCSANNAQTVLDLIKHEVFKLIIVDRLLPDMQGYELAMMIRKIQNQTPILCLNWGSAPPRPAEDHLKHTYERPQNFKRLVGEAISSQHRYDIIHI